MDVNGVRSVNVLVRDASGRTLLQFRDGSTKTFPLLWGFWGGRMDAADASPAHCAARELEEELTLSAAPSDFVKVGVRTSSLGEAWLLRFGKPVEWGMFRVREGAGAAFLWRREILRLPLSKPVAEHLRTDPDLFADCQADGSN
jgi:8-oxo-dGTP pyrophosphatase MutT (NUDIX family)